MIEPEIVVALSDYMQVVRGGLCPGAAGRHNIGYGGNRPEVGQLHPELLLAVQEREALVPVQRLFVGLSDGPYTDRHTGALARFDVGDTAARVAPECDPVIFEVGFADHNGTGAPVFHLLHIQVRAVCEIEFPAHIVFLSAGE